jgi:hypothetical protein
MESVSTVQSTVQSVSAVGTSVRSLMEYRTSMGVECEGARVEDQIWYRSDGVRRSKGVLYHVCSYCYYSTMSAATATTLPCLQLLLLLYHVCSYCYYSYMIVIMAAASSLRAVGLQLLVMNVVMNVVYECSDGCSV